ncbi:MAG TPA: DUF3015 domain-containing protein [Thiotrichaceae bacterium]|nr:DUF3015 domain-containing protein [Thiotrichaceae bacterium]
MKKIILTAVAVAALPVASILAAPNNVGCGLGSMVWEGQSGIAPQILAVTTNGTMANQLFGISSGTLGCSKDGVVSLPMPHKIALFTDDNLEKLARDMAVGDGESLNSLATLWEVETQDKPAFFKATQTHFAQIFPNENVTAKDVLLSLNNVLAADPALKRYNFS